MILGWWRSSRSPKRVNRFLGRALAAAFLMCTVACASSPGRAGATPSASPLAPVASPTPSLPTTVIQAWPPPPSCPTSLAGSDVCTVNIPANGSGGTYQASSGELILFRLGWSDPTRQSCDQFATNATLAISLDGSPVRITIVPCQFVTATLGGCSNQWRYDGRFLSPALAPGRHTVVGTYRYRGRVSGATSCSAGRIETIAAGTLQTFSKTITVS